VRPERWIYTVPLRLRSLFRRSRVEQELDEELQSHVERQTRANVESGMTPAQARRAALLAMGGVEQRKEECRDARGVRFVEELVADLRYAVRSLRHTPALATVVIVSLALGIGANSAIFSVLDSVMLALLPVREPERLVLLTWSAPDWPRAYVQDLEGSSYTTDDSPALTSYSFSTSVSRELAARSSVLNTLFGFAANDEHVNVGLSGRAEDALVQAVSGGYFEGFGVAAALGRTIVPSDDSASAPPVAVASFRFWQDKMGSDPEAVGATVVVNGTPVTLAGVAPPEFFGFEPGNPPDLWIPLSVYRAQWQTLNPDEPLDSPHVWWTGLVGRLKPGMTRAQAQVELASIFQRSLTADTKESSGSPVPRLHVVEAKQGLDQLQRRFSTSLWLLMAMVGLLLLIACANVAGLLLARATSRQKEIATRLSLGAPRLRLVRQLLTESVLLSLLGGAAGLLVARWAASVLVGFFASSRNRVLVDVHFDWNVLLFTTVVSVACGILFGLAPALRVTRTSVVPALKGSQRSGSASFRSGKALVAVQVGLGLVLLVSCGLMLRTLQRLQTVDVGFPRERLLVFRVKPGLNGYAGERLAGYYEELQRRIAAIPGVQSVSFSQLGPIGSGESSGDLEIPGYTAAGARLAFHRHLVGPGYFATLGVPVVAGRAIGPQDGPGAPRVAVVNQAFARKYFHGDDPIGHIVRRGSAEHLLDWEVVGVVGDVRYNQVRNEPPPTVYFSYRQAAPRTDYVPFFMSYLVRTQGEPRGVTSAVQRAALELDPDVPLANLHGETEVIDQVLFLERAFAWLASGFGLLALVLACVGLYGTIGYTVAQRTNEIGIRMALGADRTTILKAVLRETLLVVAAGIAAGIPLAWAATRLLKARLYELSPHDPATLVTAVASILVVTLAAGFLPARRASRVDPLVALRYE
jgi:predicted permease